MCTERRNPATVAPLAGFLLAATALMNLSRAYKKRIYEYTPLERRNEALGGVISPLGRWGEGDATRLANVFQSALA